MRWLAKAFLQKTLSALPQSERANYLLQRHVTHSLPGTEAGFRQRFKRAERHVQAYREHGPERPMPDEDGTDTQDQDGTDSQDTDGTDSKDTDGTDAAS